MTREKSIEILQAVLNGQKEKAAYLLRHANDPEVICYFISFDGSTAERNGKIISAEELEHEMSEAEGFGKECIDIDFCDAL